MANPKKISKMHKRVQQANISKSEMSLEELLKQSSTQAPPNDFWDQAAQHYRKSIQAIHDVEGTLVGHLQNLIQDEDLFNSLPQSQDLLNSVKLLHKDVMAHIQRLNSIYDTHKDKNGGTKTPDEHIQVININQQYADVFEVYQANILPVVNHILEQIGATEQFIEALKISEQEKAKSELADVNVISDVEAKEVEYKDDRVSV